MSHLRRSVLRLLPPAALLLGLLAAAAPVPARAQGMRPWVPPAQDSLRRMAAEARRSFERAQTDSAVGDNLAGFEQVDRIVRRMLRSLGRDRMHQAFALGPALDSLKLDTDVAIDPSLPYFVFVAVHNHARRSALSLGFLYWWKQGELRVQGVQMRSAIEPEMRVWWTSDARAPYLAAVIGRARDASGDRALTLMAMSRDGNFFDVVQYEGSGPDLGGVTDAAFMDVDGRLPPELVAWGRAMADSTFELCRDCPAILSERLYVMREGRYEYEDERILPSPLGDFMVFVRQLQQGNRAAAARIVAEPALVDTAMKHRWDLGRGKGTWRIESVEEDRAWPRWFVARHMAAPGRPRYVVRYVDRGGRWAMGAITRVPESPGESPPGPVDAPVGGARR